MLEATSMRDRIRKAAKKTGDTIYETAARIERDAHQRTGAVGGLVKAIERAEREIERAKGEIPRVEQEVREYLVRAKEAVQGTLRTAKDRAAYLENILFPNGQYDSAAAAKLGRKMLEKGEETVLVIGKEAYETLGEAVEAGAALFETQLHRRFPTMDELDTTYAGLGAKYQGIPTRDRLDRAIAYHEKARKQIPGAVRLRAAVLQDIKDYAATHWLDLGRSLQEAKDPLAAQKVGVARKYHV